MREKTFALVRDAMLGAVLVAGKEVLAVLPNVEVVSMLLLVYATVYRFRALVPLYLFVAIEGVLYPSPVNTVMYLYVFLPLVLFPSLLPKGKLPPAWVYVLFCSAYCLSFGALCAPAQALYFHYGFDKMLAWIAVGFPYDLIHALSGFCSGFFVLPLARLLLRLESKTH